MKNKLVLVLGLIALIVVVTIAIGKRESGSPSTTVVGEPQTVGDAPTPEMRRFLEELATWQAEMDEIRTADLEQTVKDERFEAALENRPDVEPAVQSALELIRSESDTEKVIGAAQFLIDNSQIAQDRGLRMLAGMEAMAKTNPDFPDWDRTLLMADAFTPPGFVSELDEFFEQFDTHVDYNKEAIATARYYSAMRQMTLANWFKDADTDRTVHRDRALAFATGLSKGVEDKELMRRQPRGENGEALPNPTFARAEQELLVLLNNFTVGATTPDALGTDLGGSEDALANYKGRVLLLDFWATWCAPCIEALPKIDELKADLPQEQFEVISINTDEAQSTLTDFIEQRPMPWVHWYVGENAEMLRTWAVRGFPTYILIDQEGVLVAKQHELSDAFLELIATTVRK